MTKNLTLKITGMHCSACEVLIRDEAAAHPLVTNPSVNLEKRTLEVQAPDDLDPVDLKAKMNGALQHLGYRFFLESENPQKTALKEILLGLGIGAAFLGLFFLLQFSGVINLINPGELSLSGGFVLGILASVSGCFALVGGLLVTFTAEVGSKFPRQLTGALTAFHLSRLGAFFILGGILGHIGQVLELELEKWSTNHLLFGLAAVIMTILGIQLLGIFPVKARMRGPDTTKAAKKLAGAGTAGSGVLLGLATFFLPCGFTLLMQFQALSSGNFMEGALLMVVFALGTLPVLLAISFFLGKGLSGSLRSLILRASGVVVLGLGLYQLYLVSVLLGWLRP